jgi:hypothetical protein
VGPHFLWFQEESDDLEDETFSDEHTSDRDDDEIANLVELISPDENMMDISNKSFYECLAATNMFGVPNSYKEAITCPDRKEWIKTMDREMDSIKHAQTYQIKRPLKSKLKKKPIKNRWVLTIKRDKKETFAPVAKFKSIRVLAALKAMFKLDSYQDDVPTAFLRGELEEEVWMELFIKEMDSSKVLEYGLTA